MNLEKKIGITYKPWIRAWQLASREQKQLCIILKFTSKKEIHTFIDVLPFTTIHGCIYNIWLYI